MLGAGDVGLTRVEVPDGDVLVAYRLVGTTDRADPALLECFKSNRAKGQDPRPGSREEREPLIHDGISVFKTRAQAIDRQRRISRRLPAGQVPRIGDHVATLELRGPGVLYLDPGTVDGHMTIWAEASRCMEALVDIERIEG